MVETIAPTLAEL